MLELKQESHNSAMFDTLAWMGLLSTEEKRIRLARDQDVDFFESLDLTNDDIERVGYFYPHVAMPPSYKDLTELWIQDHYLNPKRLQWIETVNYLYAVLDGKYDDLIPVQCWYNPSIIYRYSNVVDDDANYIHSPIFDVTELRFSKIKYIEHAAYYISEDKVRVPTVEWLDDTHIQFKAPYRHDIDFFLCTNLINVVEIKAGKGVLVDNAYSNQCYHHIIIDHDPTYKIDSRFYPCITTDKDCVARVIGDSYHTILFPEVSRLINYEEFLDVEDPYNTDNEYLSNLEPVDDVITADDTEEEIVDKFSRIAAYCYRMWENYPIDTNEINDFVICDNASFTNKYFIKTKFHTPTTRDDVIFCKAPYEPYRDLLFYDGQVFSDYTIEPVSVTSDGNWIKDRIKGEPLYIIPATYEADRFTLIKFNTAEDTQIMNVGDYFDVENMIQLHHKVNRFYRNLLILRQEILDTQDPDYVRVRTQQPDTKDEYLWFELLVNAVPEEFSKNPIDMIHLYGLNGEHVPDTVREGAYRIDLDPEGGPAVYNDFLMTYFKLDKSKKHYLALQYGNGIDDPRVKTFEEIKVGKLKHANRELNALVIEDHTKPGTYTEKVYEEGYHEQPPADGHEWGDLYFKKHDLPEPPDDQQNIQIDKIEYGPSTPTEDVDKTLWIEHEGTVPGIDPNLPEHDEWDADTKTIKATNDSEAVQEPEVSDYTLESNTQSFEEDEDLNLDELLGGVNLDTASTTDTTSFLGDVLDGITDAITNNKTVDTIINPQIGEFAMDEIHYSDEKTGAPVITMDDVRALSKEKKVEIIGKLITDDDVPNDPDIGDYWISYLSNADSEQLNTIVYKVLLAAKIYDINHVKNGDIAIIGENLPREDRRIAYGEFLNWVYPDQLAIEPMQKTKDGTVLFGYNTIVKHNVRYIMSYHEPADPAKYDVWFDIPAAVIGDVIKDLISCHILEFGTYLPDKAHFDDSGYDAYGTFGFDYHGHEKEQDKVSTELFNEVLDDKLHPIYYGDEVKGQNLQTNDIWYEFLDTIDNRVAFADEDTMVIRMDERLLMLQFVQEDVTCFAFDDVFINFRGTLGVKYYSILADLINSHEISLKDTNIFYKRLITQDDHFDPGLRRLYTDRAHVISTIKVEPEDYAIMYSTNVGRFRIDYSNDKTVTNKERGWLYRMTIDLRKRDFSYIPGRMVLFVNGKYIPRDEFVEERAGMLHLTNFHEIIATVDILYSKTDQHLIDLKTTVTRYWSEIDINYPPIERPSTWPQMDKIKVYDATKRGYYDVLLNEYIFNGRLLRNIHYLQDHPEEAEEYVKDLKRKFHAISDIDLSDMSDEDAKIVISANAYEGQKYTIQE